MNEKESQESGDAIDLEKEEAYWREHHHKQPYAGEKTAYDHYAPAYRTGYEGFVKHQGKDYAQVEDDLALDYEKHRIGSALPWDEARHATRAAWEKLGGVISPRDPSRGTRYGI